MARGFLALVGTAYLILAIWCAALPETTSQAVGFTLQPGSGQSEYYVVYGGLQLALGITFLWPLRRREDTDFALRLCCLIHSCLVAFRAASLVRFSGIGTTTYALAATEWAILIGAVIVWLRRRREVVRKNCAKGGPDSPQDCPDAEGTRRT
ncbi:MAG: hypothetical protein ACYTGL_06695 [Planctomycetota bacterium]|jgi:hypothetical protein